MMENTENTNLSKEAENQRAKEIAHQILKRSSGESAEKHVRASRNTLFVLAGLFFLNAILYGAGVIADDVVSLAFYGVIGVIYMLLALWTRTNPKVAVILGLLLYLLNIGLGAMVDVSTLFSGIIMKVIIIAYLVRGIIEANKIPKKTAVNLDTLDSSLM